MTRDDCVLPGRVGYPKDASRVWLLIGTLIAVLALRFSPAQLHFEQRPDSPGNLLSTYLVDTDFLTRCAEQHAGLISRTDLLDPEIRIAVLQLASANTGLR